MKIPPTRRLGDLLGRTVTTTTTTRRSIATRGAVALSKILLSTTTILQATSSSSSGRTTGVSAMSTATTINPPTQQQVPRLYLGTMTFGWTAQTSSPVDETVAQKMVEKFIDFDRSVMSQTDHAIDTARIYAGGKTEQILGKVLSKLAEKEQSSLLIGTKAAPSAAGPDGLSPVGIQKQFETSMECLHGGGGGGSGTSGTTKKLHEYYLHQPDTGHDLLGSLRELDVLKKNGLIEHIGMSNYHYTEVERAFELCEQHGLTKPTVYQGLYNPLNRMVEQDLLPLLAKNNCAFVAYNPLAAGLLTGKHKLQPESQQNDGDNGGDKNVLSGRFYKNPNYLPRFYTKSNFDALRILKDQCDKDGLSLIEATFQWLLDESMLDASKGDGLLLGASSIEQFDENLKACGRVVDVDSKNKRMSDGMRQAFDKAWDIVNKGDGEDEVFCYWRSYSSDMPNRDNLHQGASYNAAKVVKKEIFIVEETIL